MKRGLKKWCFILRDKAYLQENTVQAVELNASITDFLKLETIHQDNQFMTCHIGFCEAYHYLLACQIILVPHEYQTIT